MRKDDRPNPDAMPPRWQALVVYRSQNGPIEVDFAFEELAELHGLIERGPNWDTIERIVVTLDPERVVCPGDTIEDAAER
jgi:hypothetical protein